MRTSAGWLVSCGASGGCTGRQMSPQRGTTAARSFQSGSRDLTPSDYFTKDWQGGMKAKARFARIYQLFGLAALTLGLLAGAAPASASPGSGWLRLAHLSPKTPAVDVYLYSFPNSNALIVVPHVAYGTISGYQKVPAGEYTVAMRAAGADPPRAPAFPGPGNVPPGARYRVVGLGPPRGWRFRVLRDRLPPPRPKPL